VLDDGSLSGRVGSGTAVKTLDLANNVFEHLQDGSGEERVLHGSKEEDVLTGYFREQESVGAKHVQMMRWWQPFFPLGTPVAHC